MDDIEEKKILVQTDDILEREREIEIQNRWRSCCFTADKRVIVFISQLLISLLVICFCLRQLIYSTTCETDQLYTGLLSLILGTWLPSPRINNK